MRILRNVFVTSVLVAPMYFCVAQTAPDSAPTSANAAPATMTAPNPAAAFNPAAPSDILQRSLGEVNQTVGAVKLDRWRRGSVRDEAQTNIDAIQRDMKGSLPSLLKDADGSPATLSKVLPLSRNVDALYDVLVHLVEQARVSGTGEDAGQLGQAMTDLEKARVALDNQILQTAGVQEKQIVDLRATVQKQEVSLRAAAAVPPPPKCPVPPPPAKKKRPAAKPGTTTSTTPNTATKPAANSNGTSSTNPPKPQQ
jgi:hypothetical protein